MGKSTISIGLCSIAMLNYQGVFGFKQHMIYHMWEEKTNDVNAERGRERIYVIIYIYIHISIYVIYIYIYIMSYKTIIQFNSGEARYSHMTEWRNRVWLKTEYACLPYASTSNSNGFSAFFPILTIRKWGRVTHMFISRQIHMIIPICGGV